jgi:hypothetical protein
MVLHLPESQEAAVAQPTAMKEALRVLPAAEHPATCISCRGTSRGNARPPPAPVGLCLPPSAVRLPPSIREKRSSAQVGGVATRYGARRTMSDPALEWRRSPSSAAYASLASPEPSLTPLPSHHFSHVGNRHPSPLGYVLPVPCTSRAVRRWRAAALARIFGAGRERPKTATQQRKPSFASQPNARLSLLRIGPFPARSTSQTSRVRHAHARRHVSNSLIPPTMLPLAIACLSVRGPIRSFCRRSPPRSGLAPRRAP